MDSRAVLSIKNLEIRDSLGSVLVENISLEVLPQEIVCIQGQSGVGKTITALAAIGLLPSSLKATKGEIWLDGSMVFPDNSNKTQQLRGNVVSMVFQDPKASFNLLHSIGSQMGDVLQAHYPNMSLKERRYRVENILGEFGFENVGRIYHSYVNELSGGQLQRCLLASSLLIDIKLLIADEPTGSLDNKTCIEIMEVIKQINEKRKVSVLMITHDSKVAEQYAHRLITFSNGASVNSLRFEQPSENKREGKKTLIESNDKLKTNNASQPAVVRVVNLSKKYFIPNNNIFRRYKESIYALNNFTMELNAGEILGVVGSSGCGKTTLAKCLVGLIKWDQGKVEINGQNVISEVRPQRSAELGIQMIWQHPFSSLNPVMSVEEILSENIRKQNNVEKPKINKRIISVLEQVELPKTLLNRRPSELSGGECQRVAIASILLLESNILIADEAVSFLDLKTKIKIIRLLEKLRDGLGLSLIFMSHDLDIISLICDRTIELVTAKSNFN